MAISKEMKDRAAEQLTKRWGDTTSGSGMYGNFFRTDKDFSKWEPGTGKHAMDIVPYFIGAAHPLVKKGKAKPGDWGYVLQIFVHRNVGVNQDTYICPARTLGQPCPICEEGKKHDMGEKETPERKAWTGKL